MDTSGPPSIQGKTLQTYRDATRPVTPAELAEREEAARAGSPVQGKAVDAYRETAPKIKVIQPAVPQKGKSFQDYMAASQGVPVAPAPAAPKADTSEGKTIAGYASAARKLVPR